jgi:hypothetical protein
VGSLSSLLAILPVIALGCGGGRAYRPFEVEIRGLSARASTLVVKVIPGSAPIGCGALQLDAAPSVSAPIEQRWMRGTDADRRLEIPEIDAGQMTIIAYAEDEAGKPIQLACRQIEYSELGDLEAGLLILTLSQRATTP